MRLQFWAADTLRFSVTGPEPHRFLNRAAAAGVRLRRVRWQRDGYAATVSGADRRRLERIARDGGWTLAVTARRGPGKHTERLLQTRPGLAAGLRALGLRVVDGQANYLLFRAPADFGAKLRRHGAVVRGCGNYPGLDPTWYRTAVRTQKENEQLLKIMREVLA